MIDKDKKNKESQETGFACQTNFRRLALSITVFILLGAAFLPAFIGEHALADMHLSTPYYSKDQNDQAISDVTKAIEIYPEFADAYYNRGIAYGRQGQYDRAISDFTIAIEIYPEFAEAYEGRGIAYGKKGQHDQAISDYNMAIKINPRLATAYESRGIAYSIKRQHDQAISNFNKAIEINPKLAEVYYNRGIAYGRKGQYDRAISDFTKTIEINPKFADAYYKRGTAYRRKGQHDQAISDYNMAIKINPRLAKAYESRGITPEQDNLKATVTQKDIKTTNKQKLQIHAKIDGGKTDTIAVPDTESEEKAFSIKQQSNRETMDQKPNKLIAETVSKKPAKEGVSPVTLKQKAGETKKMRYTIPYLIPLINNASYQKAALKYHGFLKRYPKAYSIRLEVVCQSKSILTAYQEGKFNPLMFILPKKLGEKSCFAVFWGLYSSHKEAQAAIGTIPAFFTKQQSPPVPAPLRKYL